MVRQGGGGAVKRPAELEAEGTAAARQRHDLHQHLHHHPRHRLQIQRQQGDEQRPRPPRQGDEAAGPAADDLPACDERMEGSSDLRAAPDLDLSGAPTGSPLDEASMNTGEGEETTAPTSERDGGQDQAPRYVADVAGQ